MPPLNLNICLILFVSACLTATTVWLLTLHVRTWRAARQGQLDAEELDYQRRQYRRRMLTSGLLGLLAIALSAGHYLAYWIHSNWFEIAFWGTTLLAVCWFGLLALADLRATQQHLARQHERYLAEQIRLMAEARRIAAGEEQGLGNRD